MLVSFQWLRALGPFPDDVRRVAAVLTSRGLTVDSIETAGDDHVLDVDVPANRPDCLGHLGLAREVAAGLGVALNAPAAAAEPAGEPVGSTVRVSVDEPDLCWRYTGRLVRGVRWGASPDWVVRRLEACGLRSISNVVDASNLVLLETGNPIHFFDVRHVAGGEIRVRRGASGEKLTTLDDVERTLDPERLVIADAERAVALAGVIGGAESEIGEDTRDVLIEAAWFLPSSVRRTARRLGISTDASYRFERGVDPGALDRAQDLAVRLLVELADGRPAPGQVEAGPGLPAPRTLRIRGERIERLLGYRPESVTWTGALEAVGLRPRPDGDDAVEVVVPSWRVDLEREADLVEEVARHLGYDRIPSHTDGVPVIDGGSSAPSIEEGVRDRCAARGFHEAFGYAMIGHDEDAEFLSPADARALELSNPIAETLACLRRSIVPGLLRAADLNLRRGVADVRLFEIGHVFLARGEGELPEESRRVGLLWCGAGEPRHWSAAVRPVELADIAGLCETILASLRPETPLERRPATLPGLHPGQALCWHLPGEGDTRPLGWAGALHPRRQRELGRPAFVAELDLDVLEAREARLPRYAPLPRLSPITRDLAVIVGPDASYGRLAARLRSVAAPVPAEFEVVDRYAGPPLEEGEHSLTVRVTLYPDRETPTDETIERYRRALIEALGEEPGMRLRGDGSVP